jgi:hypothetical protein
VHRPNGQLTIRAAGYYAVQTPYTITTSPTTIDVALLAVDRSYTARCSMPVRRSA